MIKSDGGGGVKDSLNIEMKEVRSKNKSVGVKVFRFENPKSSDLGLSDSHICQNNISVSKESAV